MAERVDSLEVAQGDRISIIGRNLQVTAPMREHILSKLHKIEETTPGVIAVVVYLEVQKLEQRAEILYKFSHFTVMAHGSMPDMYQAFDLACSRVRGKLRKWKTQIQSHHGKKISEVELNIQVLDRKRADVESFNDQIEEAHLLEIERELAPLKIAKKKKKSVPLLTTSEAAMRMDFSDDNFMVYRCEEDMKLKVMYIRRDRTLGILEVE